MDLTTLDKQQSVYDLLGDWLDDNSMNLLAKEGILVYWHSITGEELDFKWHTLTVVEASRIAKVMFIPPALMSYCTSDAVYAAAQERGRAYMEGVRSLKPVLGMYFNYTEHEKIVKCPYSVAVDKLVMYLYQLKINLEWSLVQEICLGLFEAKSLDELSTVKLNTLIKESAAQVGYRIRHGANRYMWSGKKWQCLQIPRTSGVVFEYDTLDTIHHLS